MVRRWLKVTFFICIATFGAVYGERVPVEHQVSLIEGIKSSAAIIFGVVAAWMAIVYPDELRSAIKPGSNPSSSPLKSIRLFKAFYVASASLLIAILFPVTISLATSIFPLDWGIEIARVGLAFTLVAAFLQVWCLKMVVFSTELLRHEVATLRQRVSTVQRLLHRR